MDLTDRQRIDFTIATSLGDGASVEAIEVNTAARVAVRELLEQLDEHPAIGIGEFEFAANPKVITGGVVTLTDWIQAANGQTYKALFADRWEVVTDKAMPVDGFHSSEKWTLVGVVGVQPVVIIPGCKVFAWTYGTRAPESNNVLDIRSLMARG